MLFKNEGRLQMFHEQYPDIVKRKKEVIEKFDSKELEHLLSNSTKNVAQEVVGCLIPGKGKGILNEIENSFAWAINFYLIVVFSHFKVIFVKI